MKREPTDESVSARPRSLWQVRRGRHYLAYNDDWNTKAMVFVPENVNNLACACGRLAKGR